MNNKNLIGKIFHSRNYGDFKIIEYTNYFDVTIEFVDTKFTSIVNMTRIRNGKVKDYSASTYLKYININATSGYGIYDSKTNYDAYSAWSNMLTRCYNPKYHQIRKTYMSCSVCKEWLNFQNFAEWYYQQYIDKGWVLDKDIIQKGNKIYSPDTCCLVPVEINSLFTKANCKRNKDFPIGVHLSKFIKNGIVYQYIVATCSDGTGKNKHLGVFDNIDEAFCAYKHYKESLIKVVANKYKELIDPRLYQAMLEYKVEITD